MMDRMMDKREKRKMKKGRGNRMRDKDNKIDSKLKRTRQTYKNFKL